MINVQLNGVDYENFTTISVTQNIESISGAFSFTSTASENNLFPIRVGDSVKIVADGTTVLTGYVERLSVSYDASNHYIEASGRNVLADFIDSTVGTDKEFEGNVSLIGIARSILNDLGLSTLQVIDEAGNIEPFDEWDIESAEVGVKCFEFVERLARKRQALWRSDGDGNLILFRASNQRTFPYKLVCRSDGVGNNIISALSEIDYTNRYNQYKGQGSLSLFNINVTPAEAVEQESGPVYDNEIRKSRVLEFNAEENSDSQTATERAIWESNIRVSNSLTYSVTVQGHSVEGIVWPVNVLIDVDDEIATIKDQLFVKSVVYSQSIDGGTTTRLNMTYKNAFRLEAEEQSRQTEVETLF